MTGSERPPGGDEQGESALSSLVPGRMIGAGRYRLLAPHGAAKGFRFWHAFDSTLEREVALTVVPAGAEHASVLERTLRLGHVDGPGLARILDVVDDDEVGGLVVAEWTPGLSLREIADASAAGSAHAVRALAEAAELAHRSQGALSIDHPDRIRISTANNAVLAFPAVPDDANPKADVQGVGAVLYALLTGTWALREHAPSADATHSDSEIETVGGLPVAPRDPSGAPLAPHVLRPEVEYPISFLAVRALGAGSGGLSTAATVVHVIDEQQTTGSAAATSAIDHSSAAGASLGGASASSRETGVGPDSPNEDSDRNKRKKFALVGAVVVASLLLIWGLASAMTGELKTEVPEVADPSTPISTSSSASAVPPPVASSPPSPSSAESTSPPEVQAPIEREPAPAPEPPAVQAPPPPPAPAPAPAPTDVLPCYPGYHHEPAPDGPCLPDGGPAAPAPAPAEPPPPPAEPGPNELPCYPGYYHDPSRGGQCWAN